MIDTEDDAPTYVDENHETLSKEDYDKLNRGEDDSSADVATSNSAEKDQAGPSQHERPSNETEPKANFGNAKKRKAVKVIGNEDDAEESVSKTEPVAGSEPQATADGNKPIKPEMKKSKSAKKGKKIKLSFDDDQA